MGEGAGQHAIGKLSSRGVRRRRYVYTRGDRGMASTPEMAVGAGLRLWGAHLAELVRDILEKPAQCVAYWSVIHVDRAGRGAAC